MPPPPGSWVQVYEPHGFPWWLSALIAALPVAVLFYLLGVRRTSAPRAALGGAATAILVAIFFTGMPWPMALAAFADGAAFGLFPIGWIVFTAILLYQIAVDTGQFEVMKFSIGRLTADRRLQALLIAFSFGAIIEGAAGFGAPVAISAALLAGLGFRPRLAAVLCLIANTAPVAWGSVGIPLVTLARVSGLPLGDLSAMNARILPFTSVLVPIWLLLVMVGLRGTLEVLPAALICGVSFAAVQFLWGNFVDAGLVDIVAGLTSLLSLAGFLLVWKPRRSWRFPEEPESAPAGEGLRLDSMIVLRAWLPFLILLAFVIAWGLLKARYGMDKLEWGPVHATYEVPVPGLHQKVLRTLPVVKEAKAEDAIFNFNWLSATGTAVLLACLTTCVLLGHRPRAFARSFLVTCRRMKTPILAIVPMLGLGFLTRYSGLDAILGLAFTKTGPLYPIFGTYLGWLGVALTGSDTSSNALFGSLQRITAEQLKISPILMCSANSAGGVMGKMVDAQSIVVAAAASGETGGEGKILAAVIWHSIALAAVVALIVLLYAYLFPGAVPSGVKLLG